MPDHTGERFTITETADGHGYQVLMQIDGFEAQAFCSSYHLVEDKLAQLRKAIADEAILRGLPYLRVVMLRKARAFHNLQAAMHAEGIADPGGVIFRAIHANA